MMARPTFAGTLLLRFGLDICGCKMQDNLERKLIFRKAWIREEGLIRMKNSRAQLGVWQTEM